MATSAAANPTRTPSGILTFLGGIVLLGLFAAIVVYWISSKGPKDDVDAKRAAARIQTRQNIEKETHEKLFADAWVDKNKGVARIALADAIKLTIDDLKAKKVAPSAMKVEAPIPIPVADPNSKEPAPPSMPSAPQGAETFPFGGPAIKQTAAPANVLPAPAAPATPTPAAPAPSPAAPAPAAPTETPAPVPAPVAPAVPAPAPAPAPAAPAEAKPASAEPAAPSASASNVTRQPLINWTETK